MEYIFGPALVLAVSLGFTEFKMKKHQKEYQQLVERVEAIDKDLGRQMLGAMVPMSRSIKELQELVGTR
tara:strand:- start:166 stop:372 length:207 start_codon:yes stop_codon:yes gene_type:complete